MLLPFYFITYSRTNITFEGSLWSKTHFRNQRFCKNEVPLAGGFNFRTRFLPLDKLKRSELESFCAPASLLNEIKILRLMSLSFLCQENNKNNRGTILCYSFFISLKTILRSVQQYWATIWPLGSICHGFREFGSLLVSQSSVACLRTNSPECRAHSILVIVP